MHVRVKVHARGDARVAHNAVAVGAVRPPERVGRREPTLYEEARGRGRAGGGRAGQAAAAAAAAAVIVRAL